MSGHNIFFAPEPKNAWQRIWDINQAKSDLGLFTCKHILLLHALLGCDITSRLFDVGKGTVVKKFKVNSCLQQAANVFDEVTFSPTEIESAGEKALVVV